VHVKSAPLTLHKSYFNALLPSIFLIPAPVNALPFKKFEQGSEHSLPLTNHWSAWPVNVSKYFSIPASSCHLISPSSLGLIKWQLVSKPSPPPTRTENGTAWLVVKSRLPALLVTPFHARSSHSWRAHGMLSFTTTNPRWKNAGWFIEFRGYRLFSPPHFTLILRVHSVGAVCRHSFAMSEALKIQILFKGTCVKYCSARPKPVGCRHFFKYLFFWGKKMTSSLALQILLRYRAPKILIYCGFLFPQKKSFNRFYRHPINSLIWKSIQRKRMYKHLSIRWFWIDRSERKYLCRTCLFIHP